MFEVLGMVLFIFVFYSLIQFVDCYFKIKDEEQQKQYEKQFLWQSRNLRNLSIKNFDREKDYFRKQHDPNHKYTFDN